MIRIALVEDEAEVRAQLQGYVQRHTRQYGTEFAVMEFADGMELLDDYRPVYDILFLDVEMKHLDGMETARRVRELCTLVGAPLDNAIESVLAEPDPEKRLLRVAIYNQSGCVMLRFENYCAQPVKMGADGLPVHNAHGGYDLQGIRAAAQHHDGTMTLHWADGWFTLRILLPVPEK